MDDWDLIESALEVRRKAYAPYSGFKVGAALLGRSGKVYLGCNVENASYGLTLCAERNALAQAVALGEREFEKLVLAAEAVEPVLPCGACLQVLVEFGANIEILSTNGEGEIVRTKLTKLLPKAFRLDRKKGKKGVR